MRGIAPSRTELLHGTLDLLILRTPLAGRAHGHAIAKHIQQTSEDLLQDDTGSLYPALYRLEAKGAAERSKWDVFSHTTTLVLNPIDQEGL